MEQRRITGKSHWYHETQSSTSPHDPLPLVPEAANCTDKFLLDLALSENKQMPFQAWLSPSRQLANQLFPQAITLSKLHSFSLYERMSTALTVAQVCGVQRLCNHYAARLAPLPGPDSSRESNHRLAQITQYARQLASSPAVINTRSRQQLNDVGLSEKDMLIINLIIGFVGFQARVIAAFQAYLSQPARWLPGQDTQQFADTSLFQQQHTRWRSAFPLVDESNASQQQLDTLASCADIPGLRHLAPVLAREPELLTLSRQIVNALALLFPASPLADFTALLVSRINGSVDCFNSMITLSELSEFRSVLRADEKEIKHWINGRLELRNGLQAIQLLTIAPDRFSTDQFELLCHQELSSANAIHVLACCGLYGWINRLKIGLGETY